MKILFATDSYKGSLSTGRIAQLLTQAAKEVFPDCETDALLIADGGEGTVQAVIDATGGKLVTCTVNGPLHTPVEATYGLIDDKRAVIEMAAASGLTLLTEDRYDPLSTSTYGVGELIRDALNRGITELYLAIGGSATNEGGMGCMRALGVRFLDSDGKELDGCGADLGRVHTIDVSGMDERLQDCSVTVMCDVDNPLCGPRGATYTFSEQKGADPAMQDRLEAGMCHYRDVIRETFHIDPDAIAGSGAAGGLGCALMVFLKGEMQSGIQTVLDLADFEKRLEHTDLVVTGEGRTDWQSCYGKVLHGVGTRAAAKNIPVVALSGSLGTGFDGVYDHGIESLMTCVDAPMSLQEAMDRAEELCLSAAVRMFRMLRTGMQL